MSLCMYTLYACVYGYACMYVMHVCMCVHVGVLYVCACVPVCVSAWWQAVLMWGQRMTYSLVVFSYVGHRDETEVFRLSHGIPLPTLVSGLVFWFLNANGYLVIIYYWILQVFFSVHEILWSLVLFINFFYLI